MPVVTKDQALQHSQEKADENPAPLVERLVAHINSGLEIDVLMDLWRLIIPRDHHLWYDEVEEKIHYNEEVEEVPWE
jgi:hypothetical protein